MKNFIGGLMVLAFAVPAMAQEMDFSYEMGDEAEWATPANEKATAAWVQLQKEGKHGDLAKLVADLKKGGFTKMGATRSALLAGMCGTGGCEYTFLTTTAYLTEGGKHQQMSVIGATVIAKSTASEAAVSKIYSPAEVLAVIKK